MVAPLLGTLHGSAVSTWEKLTWWRPCRTTREPVEVSGDRFGRALRQAMIAELGGWRSYSDNGDLQPCCTTNLLCRQQLAVACALAHAPGGAVQYATGPAG